MRKFNRAVSASGDFLRQRTIASLFVRWKEDVPHWHPGQDWVFEVGGFGVFDPGINALSILRAILPAPIWVTSARLEVPKNRMTPVRARRSEADGWPLQIVSDAFLLAERKEVESFQW